MQDGRKTKSRENLNNFFNRRRNHRKVSPTEC
jgi:hypothetical protein